MNFTIKQSNQNPIFKKLKNISYSYLTRHRAKSQSYSKKVIREIRRDKNTQKVFLNPKEKSLNSTYNTP
ncbi:hypothetical protein EC598_04655 [Helicobacter pylori]|nr:hypothetical protein EC598_04655 [Helicobacter pylori]